MLGAYTLHLEALWDLGSLQLMPGLSSTLLPQTLSSIFLGVPFSTDPEKKKEASNISASMLDVKAKDGLRELQASHTNLS